MRCLISLVLSRSLSLTLSSLRCVRDLVLVLALKVLELLAVLVSPRLVGLALPPVRDCEPVCLLFEWFEVCGVSAVHFCGMWFSVHVVCSVW